MTINSINANTSVPFTGLGTQTLNIPTTGIYTVAVTADIPWVSSDQPFATANAPALEVQDVTCAGDTAGSRNSTWWKFYTEGDVHGYYVWYNINSAGVDPAPSGLTGIEVDGATGATATTLGGATRTAIAASAAASYVTISGATTHCIITNKQYGSCTAAANGTASAAASFSITTTGAYGYLSGLRVVVTNNGTSVMDLNSPTSTQKSMGGSVRTQCTAGQVLTVVTSSTAPIDQYPNAIKGVINIFAGE